MYSSNSLKYRKTALAIALLAATGASEVLAVNFVSTFDMFDVVGAPANTGDASTGTFDLVNMTWSIASTVPFFGTTWTAHDGVLYGPGTYTISTIDSVGNTCGAGFFFCAGDGISTTLGPDVIFTVPAGYIGGRIKFAWGATDGIDVFNIWDPLTGASVDFDGDGTPGLGMVDGPFFGFKANFSSNPPISTAIDSSTPTPVPDSSTGTYNPGALAISVGSADGSGLTVADVGTDTSNPDAQCVGGCFDFTVTGLGAGNTVNIVQLLSTPIPNLSVFNTLIVYRKKVNGDWQDFDTTGVNNVASAPPVSTGPLVCPGPGSFAYGTELLIGDQCIQLTIVDGGPNDADGLADGTVTDPGGVAIPVAIQSSIGNPDTGGGATALSWWSLAVLSGWIGIRRRRARNRIS